MGGLESNWIGYTDKGILGHFSANWWLNREKNWRAANESIHLRKSNNLIKENAAYTILHDAVENKADIENV